MKIVCIATSFIPANTANSIQVMKVCDALAELGHQVTLIVPGEVQTAWDELKDHYGLKHKFAIQWVPENLKFKRYDFAIKAAFIARRMKPDLVYTWVLQAAVFALWLRLPGLLEMHDRVRGRVGPWLFRQILKSKTKKQVIAITSALKEAIIEDFKSFADPEQILVAPDAVDLERYQEQVSPLEAREALGLKETFTAGYTGHFYAGRGIELMFELAKNLPQVQFLWVGGEPEDVDFWKDRVRSTALHNVVLTGFVENAKLPTYQFACDVLLMPYGSSISVSGGGDTSAIASPMKMFEYMAAGRAIVSSDLPVFHEVLDHETAVFCPPEDLPAWQKALLDLMKDPERCKKLGEAARQRSALYSWRARTQKAINGF